MSLSINAKIPFQPGLALGSVVRGDVIEKLEHYNETFLYMEKQQKEVRNLEQALKTLKEKLNSIQDESLGDKALKKLFTTQIASIESGIEVLAQEIEKVREVSLPLFSNITTSLESPIDFDASIEAIANRGFDSITFNSQYIDMSESSQRIQDKVEQSSSANSIGVGASVCGFSIGGSYSWSSGVLKRIAEIKSQGHASKLLLINAMATTRHVRYFKNRQYDPIKLRTILNVMRQSDREEDLQRDGIVIKKVQKDGKEATEKRIYLLTEAVMGGAFSAIVTYLKDDQFQRDLNANTDHASSRGKGKIRVPASSFSAIGSMIKGKGSFERSSQKAHEFQEDEIQNQSKLNVSIEYIAQGVIPQFARENVVREAYKYQNQDFQKYNSSGVYKKGEPVESRQQELQKLTYAVLNDVRPTEVEKEALSIHTVTSVTKAYDDFCGEIVSDSSSGIPLGFNYTILTEEEIKLQL